ncbi:Uncharacterised protein [Serratia grimesii]|nr:Uncharacterised protein [Serratia grimesii]CAI1168719.1 Uncharacterised protein [Serratia grimesii]CAI2520719.1 Uncharacterised protein [Serratia grimesii]CAI2793006.1 Uncharacterised protein [Serratia grimesii]SUI37065.1 Uncharacterised protein [Serratia grimesii]
MVGCGKFYLLLRPVCVSLTYNNDYRPYHFSSELNLRDMHPHGDRLSPEAVGYARPVRCQGDRSGRLPQ